METSKISAGTIARTIVLALALVNQILTTTGHSIIPIDDKQVTELITLLITIGASIATWWKNNSFTKAAIAGDKAMNEYRLNDKLSEAAGEYDDLDNFGDLNK